MASVGGDAANVWQAEGTSQNRELPGLVARIYVALNRTLAASRLVGDCIIDVASAASFQARFRPTMSSYPAAIAPDGVETLSRGWLSSL